MITSWLLYLVWLFLWGITSPLRVLSDVSVSSNITSAISTAGSYIAAVEQVFPATTLLAAFALYIGIEGGILTYKLIRWLYQKIPGIS